MKKLIIPSVMALSLIAAPVAMAMPDQPMPHQPMKQMGPGGKMKGKHHGLSKEQRQQIKSIIMKYRDQKRQLRQQARVLRMQLDGKLVTKGTSWDEIAATVKQLNDIRGQMFLLKTQARYEVFQKTGIVVPPKGHRGKRHMRYGR